MHRPVEITFRGLDHSDAIERRVRAKVNELEQFYGDISSCIVTIEAPHHHSHQGTIYCVRIDLRVPDGEIVVNRARKDNPAHEDVYVAIRDSFDAASRQLADYVRRRRGDVKRHEPKIPRGVVRAMFPGEDYGFIEMPDGSDVYFHANAVEGGFASLDVGDEVRVSLADVEDAQGPHASIVTLIEKGRPTASEAEV